MVDSMIDSNVRGKSPRAGKIPHQQKVQPQQYVLRQQQSTNLSAQKPISRSGDDDMFGSPKEKSIWRQIWDSVASTAESPAVVDDSTTAIRNFSTLAEEERKQEAGSRCPPSAAPASLSIGDVRDNYPSSVESVSVMPAELPVVPPSAVRGARTAYHDIMVDSGSVAPSPAPQAKVHQQFARANHTVVASQLTRTPSSQQRQRNRSLIVPPSASISESAIGSSKAASVANKGGSSAATSPRIPLTGAMRQQQQQQQQNGQGYHTVSYSQLLFMDETTALVSFKTFIQVIGHCWLRCNIWIVFH